MNRRLSILSNIDKTLLAIYFTIVLCGLINVYGAVYTYDMETTNFFLSRFGKQIIWISLSLLIGTICLRIYSYFYDNFAYFFYALTIILLLVTPFFAHNVKGSLSWISIGPFAFQPAELAKIITALTLASFLGKFTFQENKLTKFAMAFGIILLPALIIAILQREAGSALVFASFILVFYRCGLPGYFLVVGIILLICFILAIRFSFVVSAMTLIALFVLWIIIRRRLKRPVNFIKVSTILLLLGLSTYFSNYVFHHFLGSHQQKRIELILGMREDIKGVGYNVHQAKIAIGSGGVTGKGFLQGTQNKLNYVPEQDTDFIFCTVGEEWGFLGATFVLLLYFALLWRLIILAERQKSVFSMVYIYSTCFILLFHVFINIGMVLGFLPVIGIPLPFFSYGGSAFLCFTVMLAIAVRMDIEQKNKL